MCHHTFRMLIIWRLSKLKSSEICKMFVSSHKVFEMSSDCETCPFCLRMALTQRRMQIKSRINNRECHHHILANQHTQTPHASRRDASRESRRDYTHVCVCHRIHTQTLEVCHTTHFSVAFRTVCMCAAAYVFACACVGGFCVCVLHVLGASSASVC